MPKEPKIHPIDYKTLFENEQKRANGLEKENKKLKKDMKDLENSYLSIQAKYQSSLIFIKSLL